MQKTLVKCPHTIKDLESRNCLCAVGHFQIIHPESDALDLSADGYKCVPPGKPYGRQKVWACTAKST